jgi:hypothetical protein
LSSHAKSSEGLAVLLHIPTPTSSQGAVEQRL